MSEDNEAARERHLVYHDFDYLNPVTQEREGVVPDELSQTVKSLIFRSTKRRNSTIMHHATD